MTSPPRRPGSSIFTIEGRAAPGLFVVGWLASLLGGGIVYVGWQAADGPGRVLVLALGLATLSIGLVAGAGAQAIERRASGRHAYSGPSPVLLFAASVAVASLGAIVIGAPLSAVGASAPRPLADLLLVTIQVATYLGLVALLVVGTNALRWDEIGFRSATGSRVRDLAWGAVIAGPVIAATVLVTAVLVAVLGEVPPAPLEPTGDLTGLALNLLAGAVLAPIGEEIIFRGVATTAWSRAYGVRSGIVRGALFFALAHVLTVGGASFGEALALAVVAFGGRVPVALALGWVFMRRGSIWASIGLHGAFNGTLLILADLAVRSGATG